jgi:glycosyltransferase involved in cell wall biosynthesis
VRFDLVAIPAPLFPIPAHRVPPAHGPYSCVRTYSAGRCEPAPGWFLRSLKMGILSTHPVRPTVGFPASRHGRCGPRVLILVPAYNPGSLLRETVSGLLSVHPDVWVLVDGSTDGSDAGLESVFAGFPGLRVLRRGGNSGKGATLLNGAEEARDHGFTHILCVDADGQHPPERVVEFRTLCESHPGAVLMGQPEFGPDAPLERVYFRRIANALTFLETLGKMRCDSLFGMRLYPLGAFLKAFSNTKWGRGYDFDTEIAVRMVWDGVPVHAVQTPVRYPDRAQGGVSHFRYGRDNLTLVWMHLRLLVEMILRIFVWSSAQLFPRRNIRF